MKWGQEMDWREPGRIGRRRQKSPKMTVPQLLAALLACLASTRTVRYCTAAVRAARAANGGTRTICLGPWVCPDRRGHPRIHETEGLESVNGGRGHRFSAQAETATRRGSDGRVRGAQDWAERARNLGPRGAETDTAMAAGGAGGGRGGGEEEDRRHGGVDEDDDIGGRMHARIQPGRFGFGGACPAAAWSGRPLRGFGVTASRQRGPWPARYQDRAVDDPGGAGTSPDWSLLAEVPCLTCLELPATNANTAGTPRQVSHPDSLRDCGREGASLAVWSSTDGMAG